jgi:hypothetical protein
MPVVLDEVDLNKALAKLDAALTGGNAPSSADLAALEKDIATRDARQTDRSSRHGMQLAELSTQLAHIRKAVFALHDGQVGTRQLLLKAVSKLYRAIEGLRDTETVEDASPVPYEGAIRLTKALAPTASRPVQTALAKQIITWFGPNGGQKIPYERELCFKLRMHKSISFEEERRWQRHGILPDRVDTKAPTAMPENDYWAQADRGARIRNLPLLALAHLTHQTGR